MQVGGRAEGFEKYIESIFGEDGLYPEEHVEAVLKGIHQKPKHEETTLERWGLESEPEEETKASLYLRVSQIKTTPKSHLSDSKKNADFPNFNVCLSSNRQYNRKISKTCEQRVKFCL